MNTPLAEQLRPKDLKEFVGQEHLLGKNKPISTMLEKGTLVSMLLWGPPGSGKTMLCRTLDFSLDSVAKVQKSA